MILEVFTVTTEEEVKMPPTNFPNGITSQGVPVVGGAFLTTGNVYFVHSGTGLDGNAGLHGANALATVDKALSLCTSNKNSTILLMPGHTESITDATGFVVDKIGVSIIGLGNGTDRPIFTFDNTAASVEIDAANVHLENILFQADVSAVVVGMNIDANGFSMNNCEFNFNATGDDFLTMVDIDAFDKHSITNCKFVSESGAAGAAEAIRLDDCHFVTIAHNHFTGQWSDAAIVGEGAAGTDLIIDNNRIYNADTTTTNGVAIAVAFTGLLTNNLIGTLYTTDPESIIDPGSLLACENYVCNNIDESGAIVPVDIST